MKKVIIVSLMFLFLATGIAYAKKATLYHPVWGDKKVVEVGIPNVFFGGYKLYTEEKIQEGYLGGKAFRPSGYSTTLASNLAEGGTETTLKVNSITLPDGTTLEQDYYGSFLILTVGSGDNEEKIAVSTLATSTKTFTITSRGLEYGRWASSTSNIKQHLPGERVFVSDDDHFLYQNYVDIETNETITGIKTFSQFPITPSSAPTSDYQVANKKYMDDAIVAGGVPATTNTAGISKISTRDQAATGSSGDGTYNYALPSSMATSTPTVATTSIPVTGTDGKLSANFIATTSDYVWTGNTTLASTTVNSRIGFTSTTTFSSKVIGSNITNAFTAAVTMTGSTTPQPVYIATTTGNVQLSNAAYSASTTYYRFDGFAITSSAISGTVYVQTDGLVSGFTGLTPGSDYYVSNTAGTISTTMGNVPMKVGRAMSATQILITHEKTLGVRENKGTTGNGATFLCYTDGFVMNNASDSGGTSCAITVNGVTLGGYGIPSSGEVFTSFPLKKTDNWSINCTSADTNTIYWQPYN